MRTSEVLDPVYEQRGSAPQFFQVWIDSWCGLNPVPCWDWNSPPKLLEAALVEAAECRRAGYPTRLVPVTHNA